MEDEPLIEAEPDMLPDMEPLPVTSLIASESAEDASDIGDDIEELEEDGALEEEDEELSSPQQPANSVATSARAIARTSVFLGKIQTPFHPRANTGRPHVCTGLL